MIVVAGHAVVIAVERFEGHADVEGLEEWVDDDAAHLIRLGDGVECGIDPKPVPRRCRQHDFTWNIVSW